VNNVDWHKKTTKKETIQVPTQNPALNAPGGISETASELQRAELELEPL
jgi:hypothetical protein